MLLGWTEVDKTQSRRQSGLVCSLLVVSLVLSAVVGGEKCVQGILPPETVNLYGSSDQLLISTTSNLLYALPSMNFSCSGTITDIRMRMDVLFSEVLVYFLLFHDGLNSPTRRVSHILLNQNNTQQESPNELWRNSDPLSLPVTEGTFIGFALPSTPVFSKNINLSPLSETLEANILPLGPNLDNEFEGRVLGAARSADSSQFITLMIGTPLIDVTFSPDSSTGLTPSPTAQPSATSVRSIHPTSTSTTPPTETIPISSSTPTRPQSTSTPGSPPSQLMIIVIAVVATTVLLLLLVMVVGLVVVMVTVVCRRQSKLKEPVYENDDTDRGVSVQMTDNSTSYYEPMSLDMDPSHLHHQPRPLHTPHLNTSATGDHISMQECPAYQRIVDTPTSGEYTYI